MIKEDRKILLKMRKQEKFAIPFEKYLKKRKKRK